MLIEHEVAFVLHVRPWRETSLLVEVLTQAYGRLGLIARGVQGLKNKHYVQRCNRYSGSDSVRYNVANLANYAKPKHWTLPHASKAKPC